MNRLRRAWRAAVAAALFFTPFSHSQTFGAAEFEFIPKGPRSVALGGTGSAGADDAYAPFYNPAALCRLSRFSAGVDYVPLWNTGDNLTTASLTTSLLGESKLAFAAAYSRFAIGEIPAYGELAGGSLKERNNDISLRSTGVADGFFGASYEQMLLSIAKWYDIAIGRENFYKIPIPLRLSGGVSLKFYRQRFDFSSGPAYEGHSQDLDAGGLLSFILDKDLATGRDRQLLSLGYALKNLFKSDVAYNTDAHYHDTGERVRVMGLSYRHTAKWLQGSLFASADLIRRGDAQVQRLGVEYLFREILAFRGGFLEEGYTAGFGLRYKAIMVDYAFRAHTFSNTPYQIGMGVSF